jgi:hypothetical protein
VGGLGGRQLPDGRWTSKTGPSYTINVWGPTELNGGQYNDLDKVYRVPTTEWSKIRGMKGGFCIRWYRTPV